MTSFGLVLVLLAGGAAVYTYLLYPLLLILGTTLRRDSRVVVSVGPDAIEWPRITITVPAYNEEDRIGGTLEALLAADYPSDRRTILVVSDGSTDRTDEIVGRYADKGVALLRTPSRMGKTAAEHAAHPYLEGDIVINTDASVRVHPAAVRALVRALVEDPSVGLASGRDVSTGGSDDATEGEGGYVGYEMAVRSLETRNGGIIGASGCLYAIRSHLHKTPLPAGLSRDFASALITREHGLRAVSVDSALCRVPRTGALRKEYRRKVRTISRGIQTLAHKRHLLNPARHGGFAWKLWSHKVFRWLVPIWMGLALVGLALMAPQLPAAGILLGLSAAVALLAISGWYWPDSRTIPSAVALPAYLVFGNLAVLHAWTDALRRVDHATWEPTRRAEVAGE